MQGQQSASYNFMVYQLTVPQPVRSVQIDMCSETRCPKSCHKRYLSGKYTETNVNDLHFGGPCTSKIRTDEHVGVRDQGISLDGVDEKAKITAVVGWRIILWFETVSGRLYDRRGWTYSWTTKMFGIQIWFVAYLQADEIRT
jgi:hypothetical protein